ncbi:hypothetical protein JCM5350_008017 [Sporobolomyces pararoseus]
MEKRASPPHTPPPPSTRNNPSLAPNPPGLSSSPPPLRARSPFANLCNPPLIIEDDGDETSSEEESPIKDREASRWLAKQGRRSISEDSVYSSPGLSDRADVQGIVSAFGTQGPIQGSFARKTRFEDSPASIRSSSSSFSDRYVPPPLRRQSQPREEDFFKPNPYLPSLGKNNLASFDRSSAPEPEDSFYTFSNEPSFAFSHFSSTTPSTPNTSRNFSRSFGFSPKGFAASPPLPRSISRPSRLKTPSFERQQVIAEVEEDEATLEVGVPLLPEVDEFDQSEEPLGPVLPLASVREKGTEVDLSHLKAVDLDTPVEDCSGCGLVADRSFVVFNPCRHSCCPDCLNSMINGAAHKPPRPSDCFSCSRQVNGFDPCCIEYFSTRGGPGIAQVLAATLQEEDHKIRTATRRSPGASTSRFVTEEELEVDKMRRLSRSGRRRSSVVAAAISASLLSRSRSKSTASFSQPSSPTALRTPPSPSASISITASRHDSLADLPSDVAAAANNLSLPSGLTTPFEGASSSSQWSEQTQGILTPVIDWSAEPMPVFEKFFPEGFSTRSSRSSLESSTDEVSIRSSLEVLPSRRTEWPVVRLDNLPWSVAADEVEHWLPDGSLASDVGFSPELVENGNVERVTLAVHILCNRVDGRTLNQAFVECSSVEAAKSIVRSRDGTRLRGRRLHVAMSTQSELLTTIFPTYTPGFSSIDALPDISGQSSPCPLIIESELAGLLELCRLESPHAFKAPERPYFNLVSIIEKLPFHQDEAYTTEQVSTLFNTCVTAVKTLNAIKGKVEEWRDILTVLIDAILRCPAFFASQKKKIVKLAGGLGFVQHVPTKTIDVFYTQPSSSRASLAAALAFPAVPSNNFGRRISLVEQPSPSINREHLEVKSNLVANSSPSSAGGGSRNSSASDAFLSILQASQQSRLSIDPSACSPTPSPSYVFPPTPSPRTAQFPSSALGNSPSRQRRRSSIARRLNIDPSLVAAVARELGVTLA